MPTRRYIVRAQRKPLVETVVSIEEPEGLTPNQIFKFFISIEIGFDAYVSAWRYADDWNNPVPPKLGRRGYFS
jgi:hypothetical protein